MILGYWLRFTTRNPHSCQVDQQAANMGVRSLGWQVTIRTVVHKWIICLEGAALRERLMPLLAISEKLAKTHYSRYKMLVLFRPYQTVHTIPVAVNVPVFLSLPHHKRYIIFKWQSMFFLLHRFFYLLYHQRNLYGTWLWATQGVFYKKPKQELFTVLEHLGSPPVYLHDVTVTFIDEWNYNL